MNIYGQSKSQKLRRQGKSINQIVNITGFSKSSVSVWVRNIKLSKKQRTRLTLRGRSVDSVEKRRQSRLLNEEKKRSGEILAASNEIEQLSLSDLKLIGSMLYWGEGRKRGARNVSFSNSDYKMVMVMMKFFRLVCLVPENKFRAHIHIHSRNAVKDAEKYWSSITNISPRQFYKSYYKKSRGGAGKMPGLKYGTIDIIICYTRLFLKIVGWINGVSSRIIDLND